MFCIYQLYEPHVMPASLSPAEGTGEALMWVATRVLQNTPLWETTNGRTEWVGWLVGRIPHYWHFLLTYCLPRTVLTFTLRRSIQVRKLQLASRLTLSGVGIGVSGASSTGLQTVTSVYGGGGGRGCGVIAAVWRWWEADGEWCCGHYFTVCYGGGGGGGGGGGDVHF